MDYENWRHLVAAAQKMKAAYLQKGTSASISTQQAASTRERLVKGPVWVSKFTVAVSGDDDSRDLLLSLIDEANDKNVPYERPESAPLHFQWVGYRSGAKKDTPEPTLSEQEKFQRLNAETERPLAILYVYGGTFVLNSPASYRNIAGSLAHRTGAKLLVVHQRLAPQNPFPSALLDVFQAYLTLIAPPPGSPHDPILPSNIVVAGDSSGACLALGLLQVLLQLRRRNLRITFHGRTIEPMVPAGMALLSPVTDLTNALPSYERNLECDIFPVPIEELPYLQKSFPTCSAWPTNPPRANFYCEAGILAHSLASPAAAADWTGTCPLWFASGQEQIVDGSRLIAKTAHAQGASVMLIEYEKMPHTFFWVFTDAPQTRKILADWAEAVVSFASGTAGRPSSALFIRAKGLCSESMDIHSLVPFDTAEAKEIMWQKTFGYKAPSFHKGTRSTL